MDKRSRHTLDTNSCCEIQAILVLAPNGGSEAMICRKCDNVVRGFKLCCPKCEAKLVSPSDIGLWILTVMLIIWIVNSWLE